MVKFPSLPADTILFPSLMRTTLVTSLVASKSRIFVQDRASYTPIFLPPIGDNNNNQ